MLNTARTTTILLLMSVLGLAILTSASAAVKVDKEITFHPTTTTIAGPGIVSDLAPDEIQVIYSAPNVPPRNLCVTLHCRKGQGTAALINTVGVAISNPDSSKQNTVTACDIAIVTCSIACRPSSPKDCDCLWRVDQLPPAGP